jgi:ADP-ribose pyrophosphatase YjhB (NUDIX family)
MAETPPDDPNARRGPTVEKIPEGDDRPRLMCPDCGYVRYDNPKVVVGAVVTYGERFLLCRRAISPRRGFWTLPAGYLELNETPLDGACREAWEEARARLDVDALLAVYHIPRISQVQMIYRAQLIDGSFEAGPESEVVDLFDWDQIPWAEIAFPSVHWALNHFREVEGEAVFAPRCNPPGELGDF